MLGNQLTYVQIPLGGPDQTLSLVGSGRFYTDRTRLDKTRSRQVSDLQSGLQCQSSLHGPTDVVCDPSRPDPRTKSVHVETERTSLRPDKVGGLVGDPRGLWVWSGRVRVVEFRNDTTRPDQRQSLTGLV